MTEPPERLVFEVELTSQAIKEVERLDRPVALKVVRALRRLAEELTQHGRPMLSDVKRLKGTIDELRLAIDDWRVLFRTEVGASEEEGEAPRGIVLVLKVAHRSQVYKRK